MNVLARISKVSEFPGTEPVEEPRPPVTRSEPHPAKTSRAYAGPSIISAGLTITGKLESAGDIQIDGKVEGDIRGKAVRIGDGAAVKGTVWGELVELSGTLEGKIEAETVVLARTARMTGDLAHRSLKIEAGAHFDGNSRPQSSTNSH
jgi:cytoskeletal protein CcmA (bactofilin family)